MLMLRDQSAVKFYHAAVTRIGTSPVTSQCFPSR